MTDRFWSKVAKSDGCWEWTGFRAPTGYGRFWLSGAPRNAHRVSWEIANGVPVPDGLVVMHLCDNRGCVNPSHLEAGTQSLNIKGMFERDRNPSHTKAGEIHAAAKLTDLQVAEIRALYSTGSIEQKEIAEIYGVSRSLVCQIVNGKTRNKQTRPLAATR